MSKSKSKNSYQKRLLKTKLAKGKLYIGCCFCKKRISFEEATLEHILPLALGGSWKLDNLALSCKSCNWDRGVADFAEYRKWKRGLAQNKPIRNLINACI